MILLIGSVLRNIFYGVNLLVSFIYIYFLSHEFFYNMNLLFIYLNK